MQWSLPHHDGHRWIPGDWHEVTGPIKMCYTGLHGTNDPRAWLKHNCRVWSMEAEGVSAWKEDKFVCRRARLLRPCNHPCWWRKAEQFIASISDVKWFQPDGAPYQQWVLFEAGTLDAAGAAARDAAKAAAWAAAGDAAKAAARDAAGDAARTAAWAAAKAAARDAAGAAAGAAARAAARDAARAAARAAAWDAAMDASIKARLAICDGIPIDPKHIAHINARWRVWEKGYCLLCDVNGVLYVYAERRSA